MISGRRTRNRTLDRATAMITEDGIKERKILSNLMVKSKSSRQEVTVGPKVSSSGHVEKLMIGSSKAVSMLD
jgi:hypothetical protein